MPFVLVVAAPPLIGWLALEDCRNYARVKKCLNGMRLHPSGAGLLKHVNELDVPGQGRHTAKRSRQSSVGSDQTGPESNGQGHI